MIREAERSITIRVGCAVSYALWILTAALLGVGTHLESVTWQSWGLAGSAAAATATIRNYFTAQNRMMRAAFELGVDKGRSEGVSQLRR